MKIWSVKRDGDDFVVKMDSATLSELENLFVTAAIDRCRNNCDIDSALELLKDAKYMRSSRRSAGDIGFFDVNA